MNKGRLIVAITLMLSLGLSACQKRDTDTHEQDKTTSPTSLDQDKS